MLVIKQAEDYISPNGTHYAQWLCECDCKDKNQVIVLGSQLKNKKTQSCGCLQKEVVSLRSKKTNKYNLSGNYGIGYTSKDEEFLFDLEDYDLIKNYCWHKDKQGYIAANDYKYKNKIFLHRLIMGFPKDLLIDHKYGEESRYDNRKLNLRIATRLENNRNHKVCSTNTSGVTGVCWDKSRNKWVAQIIVDNKNIYLGRFANFDDAVKARKRAEEKYFGEFSYDNSQTSNVIKEII